MFLTLAFLFSVGSMCGWGLEVLFRRFFSAHHWVNPGFLVGPYLPLYGFSLCTLYLLAGLEQLITLEQEWLRKLLLFLLMAIAITILEYVAGLIFIRGMKIKLWDYSERWGNINGIICPLFSFFLDGIECTLLLPDPSIDLIGAVMALRKSCVFICYRIFLWCFFVGRGIFDSADGQDSRICCGIGDCCAAGGIA